MTSGGRNMNSLRWVFPLYLLIVLGCGTEAATVTADKVGAEDQQTADVIAETSLPETVVFPETVAPETSPEDIPAADQADDDVGPQPACDPGEGCFLDECQENADCLSGWCIEHMGQKVCTSTCQEECPQGWMCSQVGASDPDVVFICVSDFANLCRPCNEAADCAGTTGSEDACVSYGEGGNFCGGACDSSLGEGKECPWGFACQTATTVDGIELEQCVAETGLCPCTKTAVELGLFTHCQLSNEFGACQGKRVCTEEGLSDCDALEPAGEVCNALDDNCNGLVDEVDLVEGTPVCDDGNDCTLDTCQGGEGCQYEQLDGGECLDGDACTIGDHCEAGDCVGQPISCDDGDVCTDDLCDGLGGCAAEYNSAPCDDQDPCTVNDTCDQGECTGFAVDCDCNVDTDCLPLEDGDLCNGTLVCDTTKLPFLCQTDPETVAACPAPEAGPDAICLQPACDPSTGECSLVPDHEGFACEDGDLCTIGDKCVAGVCEPGVALNCNDGNGCTDDSCDSLVGCVQTDNVDPCEDGNVCTTGDTCAEGVCVSGDPLVCDDANVCNGEESCDVATGCKPGQPLQCGDADPCNGVEVCDPLDGCVANDPVTCDDGNPCNGLEVCAPGFGCLPGEPVVCEDDGDVCTDTYCDPDSGCVTVLNSAPCDDNDICTTGDHCELGLCVAVSVMTCDDNNDCTDDSCNPVTGCVFGTNTLPCDDANACTTGDVCGSGVCAGVDTSTVDCDDENICTDDSCEPGVGCVNADNAIACEDGDACTFGDACQGGACAPGELLDCDDGQFCNGVEICAVAAGWQPGADQMPGKWAETRGSALTAVSWLEASHELSARPGAEPLRARLADMALRLARGVADHVYDAEQHRFREHLCFDGKPYEDTARYCFRTQAEKDAAVRKDPRMAQVIVYDGAGFYRNPNYYEQCVGSSIPFHLTQVAAATGDAALLEHAARFAADAVEEARQLDGPFTPEGRWTFRATGWHITMCLLLHRATGDGKYLNWAAELAEREIDALRQVTCPHWWRLRERSTFLDALLELHAAQSGIAL